MRKFCTVAILMLVTVRNVLAQGYSIDSFDVSIDVSRDAVLRVKETIKVTFTDYKHGIFRTIPTEYKASNFANRSIFIGGIEVADEKDQHQTIETSRENRNIKIRIGDADVLLEPGTKKVYVIRYEVANAVNWFDSMNDWKPNAEVYWNVTGNRWNVPIAMSSVSVKFPASKTGAKRARIYTGYEGQRDQQVTLNQEGTASSGFGPIVTMKLTGSRLDAWCKSPLEPGQGMTLVLSLPLDSVPKPTFFNQAVFFIRTNLGYGIPLIVLFLMFAMYLLYGKDPDGGPMVVQFDPPDGLSGPEAGALIDERVDQRDIVAGIISLAVKGYLKIIPKEVGLVFKRTSADLELTVKNRGNDLDDFEEHLLNYFARCGPGIISDADLRRHIAPNVYHLKAMLYQSLVKRGYYKQSPELVRYAWIFGGLAGTALLGVLVYALTPFGIAMPSVIGCLVGAAIVVAFYPQMPKRTRTGAVVRQKVLGFAEFMQRARGEELKWMEEKHPDQLMFERYLPHAVAFGLTEQWGAAFQDIVKEMPDWYAAPPGTPFHPVLFAHDLTSISNGLAYSATTPYRSDSSSGGAGGGSSGFSSGGFSGGGFGGGGGGSW